MKQLEHRQFRTKAGQFQQKCNLFFAVFFWLHLGYTWVSLPVFWMSVTD